MQKTGAGLVSAASTYWDADRDGLCKVMWENSFMHCVVTVYGTGIFAASANAGASGKRTASAGAHVETDA